MCAKKVQCSVAPFQKRERKGASSLEKERKSKGVRSIFRSAVGAKREQNGVRGRSIVFLVSRLVMCDKSENPNSKETGRMDGRSREWRVEESTRPPGIMVYYLLSFASFFAASSAASSFAIFLATLKILLQLPLRLLLGSPWVLSVHEKVNDGGVDSAVPWVQHPASHCPQLPSGLEERAALGVPRLVEMPWRWIDGLLKFVGRRFGGTDSRGLSGGGFS